MTQAIEGAADVRAQSSSIDPRTSGPDRPSGQVTLLTDRDRQVLSLFSQGLTYSQAARRLGITASTVDTYLRRIRFKTGASSRAELVALAADLG